MVREDEVAQRISCEHKDLSERYHVDVKEALECCHKQYYHVYMARLEALKPRVLAAAEKQLGKGKFTYQHLETAQKTKEILVIGIIEKRIGKRPSILKEIAGDEHILPDVEEEEDVEKLASSLISSGDFLELEDEKQIVKLEGKIGMDDVATGCVVGLLGQQFESNVFVVSHIIYPQFSIMQPLLSPMDSSPLVAFISGLDLTGESSDYQTVSSFLLLSQWLSGEMLVSEEDRALACRVARVVIAGESASSKLMDGLMSTVRYLMLQRQELNPSIKALERFDSLLSTLTSKVVVDLMPGIGDPAFTLFPQQPFHRLAVPKSSQLAGTSLKGVTNPYNFSLADRQFLVTSGQNVTDILRLSGTKSPCDVLSLLLRWNLVSPTCPDTVDGFSLPDRDPIVLESIPHIFVAGNQTQAEHRMWKDKASEQSCLLLSVPKFSKTKILTLVNVNTREVLYKTFEGF